MKLTRCAKNRHWPNERIKLFAKFIEQRITAIKQLSTDRNVQYRSPLLRAKIEEFTRLVDELQDNLDTYDSEHADVRKALKDLVPQSDKWEPVLREPPGSELMNSPVRLRSKQRRASVIRRRRCRKTRKSTLPSIKIRPAKTEQARPDYCIPICLKSKCACATLRLSEPRAFVFV